MSVRMQCGARDGRLLAREYVNAAADFDARRQRLDFPDDSSARRLPRLRRVVRLWRLSPFIWRSDDRFCRVPQPSLCGGRRALRSNGVQSRSSHQARSPPQSPVDRPSFRNVARRYLWTFASSAGRQAVESGRLLTSSRRIAGRRQRALPSGVLDRRATRRFRPRRPRKPSRRTARNSSQDSLDERIHSGRR